jgi:hypothetical protein
MVHGSWVHGSRFSVLEGPCTSTVSTARLSLSSRAGDRRAAPLEWKRHRLERHLDEHAISVRSRDDGHARRDLQGLHDFEERQDRRDQMGWEAVAPKSLDRVAVGDFSSHANRVESDRRGQALVEMTVVDRAGLSLGFSHLATVSSRAGGRVGKRGTSQTPNSVTILGKNARPLTRLVHEMGIQRVRVFSVV